MFIQMKNQLPEMGKGAMSFCNRTIHSQIENAIYDKSNMAYGVVDVEGFGPVARVVGVPIMTCEAITDTEAAI